MNDGNIQAVFSTLRSVIIAAGSAWAVKKGLDGAAFDAIVSAGIALLTALVGAWSNRKRPAQ